METRVCKNCGNKFPLTDGNFNRGPHGRFKKRCKACETADSDVCGKCGIRKPLTEEFWCKAGSGFARPCRVCYEKRAAKYREKRRKELRESGHIGSREKPEEKIAREAKEAETGTRICIDCKIEKPITSEFFSKKRCKFMRVCKPCCMKRRYKNREKVLESKRRYYHENKEKINKHSKEVRVANKLKIEITSKELTIIKTKICDGCGEEKPITSNFFYKDYNSSTGFKNKCKICERKQKEKYREANIDKIRESNRVNKKVKYDSDPEKYREYARSRAPKRREHYNKVEKFRPEYILKHCTESSIRHYLNGYVGKNTVFKQVGYSLEDLKAHLESQFEPWMNWSNHGRYIAKEWDDNDPSTWKWQIDHIIPCSDLPYDSVDHPNFKKCWALENLRPLSAKQNMLDGTSRVRHSTKRRKVTKRCKKKAA